MIMLSACDLFWIIFKQGDKLFEHNNGDPTETELIHFLPLK